MKKIILSSVLLLSGFFIQAQQAPDKISFNLPICTWDMIRRKTE